MNEAIFSKMLRDDIKDMLTSESINKNGDVVLHKPHVVLIQDSYRSGKKPYDFYFVYGKHFYAIECKMIRGMSIPLDCVTPHQIDYLYEVEHSGVCGCGFIVMLLADYMNSNISDKHFSLVFPVYKWKRLIKRCQNMQSVKIDEVLKNNSDLVTVMKREKMDGRCLWNVRVLIKYERY